MSKNFTASDVLRIFKQDTSNHVPHPLNEDFVLRFAEFYSKYKARPSLLEFFNYLWGNSMIKNLYATPVRVVEKYLSITPQEREKFRVKPEVDLENLKSELMSFCLKNDVEVAKAGTLIDIVANNLGIDIEDLVVKEDEVNH